VLDNSFYSLFTQIIKTLAFENSIVVFKLSTDPSDDDNDDEQDDDDNDNDEKLASASNCETKYY